MITLLKTFPDRFILGDFTLSKVLCNVFCNGTTKLHVSRKIPFCIGSFTDKNSSPYRNGKVIAGANEQSSVPNIFAIGDMADGKLELTPVAIQAGRLLAQRLYGGSNELVSGTASVALFPGPSEQGCCLLILFCSLNSISETGVIGNNRETRS